MSKTILALAVLAVAAVAAGSAGAAAKGGTSVTLHKTSLGKVLATSSGMTLYMFAADGRGKSNCYGSCATYWPPLLTKGKPLAGAGLKKSLVGVAVRKDGKRQVTYAGHPLYRFALDKKSGDTSGQNLTDFGGRWSVLNAAGKTAGSSAGAASGGGGGNGY